MADKLRAEVYQLTLTHYMQEVDGVKVYLEDPYVLAQCAPFDRVPQSIVINQILDRFKYELLRMLSERGDNND